MSGADDRVARAISNRFLACLARIQPADGARTKAEGRARAIKGRLGNSFDVARAVTIGSFYKETAVKWHSDVDLLLVLRRDAARWDGAYVRSTTLLDKIRRDLKSVFPQTAIGRDGAAVTVGFEQGSAPVDVVPGVYGGPTDEGRPLYFIPDGDGGWMLTSPDTQAAFFADANAASGGKLARVAKLVKWWARERDSPLLLSSYYVEMVLATQGVALGARRYSDITVLAFGALAARGVTAMNDPLGIGSRIRPAGSKTAADTAAAALNRAAGYAEAAWEAEARGNLAGAILRWRALFGDSFPP